MDECKPLPPAVTWPVYHMQRGVTSRSEKGTAGQGLAVIGGSAAHYWGFRRPKYWGQVPIVGGAGAHYRGSRCPS